MLVFVLPLVPMLGLLGAGFLAKGSTVTLAGVAMERRLGDAVHAARTGAFYDPAMEESGELIRGEAPNGDDGGMLELLLTEPEWQEAAAASPVVPEDARTSQERFEELMELGMTRAGLSGN